MRTINTSIFEHLDYISFVKAITVSSQRGFQAKLSKAIGCQATYLIKTLKGDAVLNEDQAYRAAYFLKLNSKELDYFLDLVRLDRASSQETKKYLKHLIKQKSVAAQNIKNRVQATEMDLSLQSQLTYFSSWKPSAIHLATSCPKYQSLENLSENFKFSLDEVEKIVVFLADNGLVRIEPNGRISHQGKSIHLAKGSSLHRVYQKLKREMVLMKLESQTTDSEFHYSSTFATSVKHIDIIKKRLLNLIEELHVELAQSESEDIAMLTVDFFPLVGKI